MTMNTYFIPHSVLSAHMHVNPTRVSKAVAQETGAKVLFVGGGVTSRGYRNVVVLEGIVDAARLQGLTNSFAVDIPWWTEEGLPKDECDHVMSPEGFFCDYCGKSL